MKDKIKKIVKDSLDTIYSSNNSDTDRLIDELVNKILFITSKLKVTDEEIEQEIHALLKDYETYVKANTTPIYLKDAMVEAMSKLIEWYNQHLQSKGGDKL